MNEQEKFWKGNFGNNYISRNNDENILNSNIAFFKKLKKYFLKIDSVFEVGCNIGLNLQAINKIAPKIKLYGIDINKKSIEILNKKKISKNYLGTFKNFKSSKRYDLVFTKGVLIHIDPHELKKYYKQIYELSNKYILLVEYFNPTPIKINYRKFKNKLFKRDFAGEMLNDYNLNLVDYGFLYKNDYKYPQDNLTWFLLKKL